MECRICKKSVGPNNIRLGACWECAEAESIIDEGLDMRNKGPKGDSEPAKTAMEKVQFLMKRNLPHCEGE